MPCGLGESDFSSSSSYSSSASAYLQEHKDHAVRPAFKTSCCRSRLAETFLAEEHCHASQHDCYTEVLRKGERLFGDYLSGGNK